MKPSATLDTRQTQVMHILKQNVLGFAEAHTLALPSQTVLGHGHLHHHEPSFAPQGVPRELAGRDAVAAHRSKLPSPIRFGTLSNVRSREAGDELIVEAAGHRQRIAGDATGDLSHVWFITTHNGKVVHFRDYMNLLKLSKAASG